MIHTLIHSFINSFTHMILDHTYLCSEPHVNCWKHQDEKMEFCLEKRSQKTDGPLNEDSMICAEGWLPKVQETRGSP